MTKDEFHKAAQEQSKQLPIIKKDTAGTTAVQARPQPPAPGPLIPKPPFGMPVIPVIKTTKAVNPDVPLKPDDVSAEVDFKDT